MGGKAKFAFAALLAVLLALSAAGCGGGGDPSSTTATGGTDTTAQQGPPAARESGGPDPGAAGPSAEFLTPGGDNSIQTYGVEAGAAERDAASTAVEAYMAARGARDWGAACRELTAAAYQPLEGALGPGSGCPATLAAVAKRLQPSAWDNTMTGPIAALRREEDHGFALYHGSGGSDYFVQMSREGGDWKVAALEPTAFP